MVYIQLNCKKRYLGLFRVEINIQEEERLQEIDGKITPINKKLKEVVDIINVIQKVLTKDR